MALGCVRFGRASLHHGIGAKGQLTDWLHGWFEFVFISFSLICNVWIGWRDGACWVCVCVCMLYTFVCMLAFTSFEPMTVTQEHSPTLAFCQLPACFALLLLVLTWAPSHTLASACDSEQMRHLLTRCCYTQTPNMFSIFNSAQKQVSLLCLLKAVCGELTIPPLSCCPLSPFPFSVSALLLTVWDTKPNLGKLRGTPTPLIFSCVWLMGFSGWFWNWMTGSCMYGNEDL